MKIVYSKDSLKFLAKMEKSTVDSIKAAIQGLTSEPAKVTLNPCKAIKTVECG